MKPQSTRSTHKPFQTSVAGIVWLSILALRASAGGGPENVLIVVNSNSESSRAIADHYVELRNIPESNVLEIPWRGGVEACSLQKFRKSLLEPILEAINTRGLGRQIDYIAYSSDFPWVIDMRKAFPDMPPRKQLRPVASLTGLTYLWQLAAIQSSSIVGLNSNWYAPEDGNANLKQCTNLGLVRSRGFRSAYFWTPRRKATLEAGEGRSYFLSTMLGVTSGRGNTVAEVFRYLDRAAEADGTRPKGTIYYMQNQDIRSVTRHDCFGNAATQLLRLGVQSQVLEGVLPQNRPDVMGLMVGAAKFDLAGAHDIILPGAICDHLTSFGGVLRSDAPHTPLTEFLRYGAAGASGTVTEPMSIQAKFPTPAVQVYYAQGSSLAEAFYQSIAGPYQLLIVGDPLCQPWAVFPTVEIHGLSPGQTVTEAVTIRPTATAAEGRSIRMFELFLDGRLVARTRPAKTITIQTEKLTNGPHELRVVAIEASPLETRGRAIVTFEVDNASTSKPASLGVDDQHDATSTAKANPNKE